jgi:hypothetical protein
VTFSAIFFGYSVFIGSNNCMLTKNKTHTK